MNEKLVEELSKLRRLEHYIRIFEKINTSLPKKKAKKSTKS